MPEQITKWITNDGYEYDTEKQAILHEQSQQKVEEMAKIIREESPGYLDYSDSMDIAWSIFRHYEVEKK